MKQLWCLERLPHISNYFKINNAQWLTYAEISNWDPLLPAIRATQHVCSSTGLGTVVSQARGSGFKSIVRHLPAFFSCCHFVFPFFVVVILFHAHTHSHTHNTHTPASTHWHTTAPPPSTLGIHVHTCICTTAYLHTFMDLTTPSPHRRTTHNHAHHTLTHTHTHTHTHTLVPEV